MTSRISKSPARASLITRPTTPAQWLGMGALGIGLAGISALAWGVGVERRWYALRHDLVRVNAEHLTQPVVILQFSDLHLLPSQTHRTDFVEHAFATVLPDIVVSLGDHLEDEAAMDLAIQTHETMLRLSPKTPGIVALGAHDRFGPRPFNPLRYFVGPSAGKQGRPFDTPRFIAGLQDAGWHVPINGQVSVTIAQGTVGISVVDDAHIDLDDLSTVRPWPTPPTSAAPQPLTPPTPLRYEPASRLATPATSAPILRLGLSHAPYRRVLERFAQTGHDLALCGHTHGGQVCIPGYGALVTNCDLPTQYASGPSECQGMPVMVTAGLGHSRYAPVRFACRPEVRVLTLVGPNTPLPEPS